MHKGIKWAAGGLAIAGGLPGFGVTFLTASAAILLSVGSIVAGVMILGFIKT